MISLAGALILSLGVGYEITDMPRYEKNPWKGIMQLEYVMRDYSVGIIHSSRTQDGFKGSNFDQNMLYIKRDFNL